MLLSFRGRDMALCAQGSSWKGCLPSRVPGVSPLLWAQGLSEGGKGLTLTREASGMSGSSCWLHYIIRGIIFHFCEETASVACGYCWNIKINDTKETQPHCLHPDIKLSSLFCYKHILQNKIEIWLLGLWLIRNISWAWWYVPLNLAVKRMKQEDLKLQVILGYGERHWLSR